MQKLLIQSFWQYRKAQEMFNLCGWNNVDHIDQLH